MSTLPISAMPDTNVVAIYTSGLLAVLTLTYFILRPTPPESSQPQTGDTNQKSRTGNIMQPPNENLAEPLDVPYTQEQLKEFDGSNPSKPIYVAIKGIFAFSSSLFPHLPLGRHDIRREQEGRCIRQGKLVQPVCRKRRLQSPRDVELKARRRRS